jgi:hypothetical protein
LQFKKLRLQKQKSSGEISTLVEKNGLLSYSLFQELLNKALNSPRDIVTQCITKEEVDKLLYLAESE